TVFVYPVGILLLYVVLLIQRLDVLANADADRKVAQSTAGLWEPYRPERFYYEVVECGRRILLTGVVVFIFPNDAAQIAITMLTALFFFAVFEILSPYKCESDMWLLRGGARDSFPEHVRFAVAEGGCVRREGPESSCFCWSVDGRPFVDDSCHRC
ncbi:unnamed protein product, partial [Ectocarpus fasciculatus]